MANELMTYEPSVAIVTQSGANYTLEIGHGRPPVTLTRDTDFGVIPNTTKPSLYKSGAEKITITYGVAQRYSLDKAIDDYERPFFLYRVKCELVAIVNGVESVVASSYGEANTSEKACGRASPYDTANSRLKIAQKRGLVGAAIALSGISDMFTQDMENEDFMSGAKAMIESADPESYLSQKQIRYLYALGEDSHRNAKQVKELLTAAGYGSTKEIKQKDYDAVIALIKEG